MHSITHFGSAHSLQLRHVPSENAIAIEVDGTVAVQVVSSTPQAFHRVWFATEHPDVAHVLLCFRRQYNTIDQLGLWVNPDARTLAAQGLAKVSDCDHWCEMRPLGLLDGRAPWDDFKDDLGLFISNGCRFSLAWLTTAILTYAVCMGFSITNLPNPTTAKTATMGVVWLVALGISIAAAVGHQYRAVKSGPERRGWTSFSRPLVGIGAGLIIYLFVGTGMHWF